jgi:XTP/dITP diphosphohydrolase
MSKKPVVFPKKWKLNTSHPGKLKEFQSLFLKYGITLEASHIDLREIESDPISVIAHKASQLEDYVLTDDTSLDIEGVAVGINVKWFLNHLFEYEGKTSIWTTLLAYKCKDKVYIYRGQVEGIIVPKSGHEGFGFDSVFRPIGSSYTLAQDKPDHVNARAKAVEALVKDQIFQIVNTIDQWKGSWQQ